MNVVVEETLLCAKCGKQSLGRYSVARFAAGAAQAILRLIELPAGFVEWDGAGRKPTAYFRIVSSGWKRRQDTLSDGKSVVQGIARTSVEKYRWGCPCGADPTHRSDRLGLWLDRQGRWM